MDIRSTDKNKDRRRAVCRLGPVLAFLIPGLQVLGAQSAAAAELRLGVTAGAGYSSNIGRTETDEESGAMALAGVDLSFEERSRRLTASLTGALSYLEYLDSDYSGELLGNVAGDFSFALIPDRLTWVLQDNFGQLSPDLFQAPSPENREIFNYLSTGPDLALHLGARNQLRIGGRYARADYERSPYDANRLVGSVAFVHSRSAAAEWSVNLQRQRTRIDSSEDVPGFTVDQAFGRYALTGRRTLAALEAGVSRLSRAGEHENGGIARLEFRRQMTPRMAVQFDAGHEITDSAGLLQMQQQDGIGAIGDGQGIAATADPYTRDYARLGFDATGLRTTLSASVEVSRDDFEGADTQAPEMRQISFESRLSRRFGARLTGSVALGFDRYDFPGLAAADADERRVGIGLTTQVGRRTALELAGEHSDRNSDLAGASSVDNRVWLRIRVGDFVAGRPVNVQAGP